MSPPSSLSTTPPRETAPSDRPRTRRRVRPLRLSLVLLVIGIAALFEPNTFRFLVGQFVRFEAWRAGVSVQIESIDGSLLEPLVLRNSVWTYESETGPVTRVGIAAATAEFSWRNLLPRESGRWFQRLSIEGLTGKIQFPLETVGASNRTFEFHLPRPSGSWFPGPERIEATGVHFIFQSNADYVRLEDTDFTLSKVEAGTIRAGQLAIKQPWLNRTFRNVRGATAIQDAKVELANLTLAPDVHVRSLAAELDDLARGQLNLSLRLDAFGGEIRVDARTLSAQRPFSFEANVNLISQINIGKLANFLLISEAAGGTIKQGGTFRFRGPPQQLSRATASLRLEATNFQWESRQWDALVVGASLMDGRVQIPELALAQGHNRLNLNGEMALPVPGVAWWQSEFTVNIAAKIENLTELSALMLPEFRFAAGKANIDGSIRGKDRQFNGQLIVSGSNLVWHNAPIEELHAAVKLNGNEFQLTNISLFNNGDYLRGQGVVNILGEKQYWGDVRASIEDLAKYEALLEKPIVPEPLAGGAVINWSGEGSAKGHSGKFSARLHKLRSLGRTAALLHPINAELDGTYASGSMQFSRFLLSDDDSSFTASVGVGNKALSLQGIKLYHRQALWLEGDALLPLDVWNAWPNTTLAKLLDDQTVTKVNLTAYNLGLREASLLTGWKFPIEGVVLGNLIAEGPLNSLKTSGKLGISKARIPIGWSGEVLTDLEGEAVFDGSSLQVKKFSAKHPTGSFSATGNIDFTNLRDPSLALAVTSPDATFRFFPEAERTAMAHLSGKLDIAGPLSTAAATGELQLLSIAFAPKVPTVQTSIDFAPLFLGSGMPPLPRSTVIDVPPWSNWKIDASLRTPAPAVVTGLVMGEKPHTGIIETDLRLTGPVSAPPLLGTVKFLGQPGIAVAHAALSLSEASLTFRDGFPFAPSIQAEAKGMAYGEPFTIQLTGTLAHPIRIFKYWPPLTEPRILAAFQRPHPTLDTEIKLNYPVPGPLLEGVDIKEWARIPTAPPAANPSTPAATPPVTNPKPATPAPAPAVPAPAAPVPATPAPAPAAAAPAPVVTPAPAVPAPSNPPAAPAGAGVPPAPAVPSAPSTVPAPGAPPPPVPKAAQ